MPPTAGTTHDITLEMGSSILGLMIEPGSYRTERVDDFAPRIATGNEPSLREGIWDVWHQNSGVGGIDQLTFSDRSRILRSNGNIFMNKPELITLEAQWSSSDASKSATAPMIAEIISGSTFVAVGVGTKVRRWNGTTWADSTTTLGANCVWLHRHGSYVYAATGTGADFYRSSDLDTWTQPAAGEKATAFASWSKNGSVYLVKATGTSFKTSTDDGVTWSSAIAVGNPDTNITGLGVAFGLLIIGKSDGLYYYDGVNVVEELQFRNKNYSGNCKALVYHDGFLYTHILGNVYKLSFSGGGISNMTDITPHMRGTENQELYGHGLPIWMWAGPSQLFVAFDDGESVYPEVLSYNGLGWHQQYRGASGDNMLAGGYSYNYSRTFINDQATRIRRHSTLRDLPFPDYPANGQFETSDFDAGLPFMFKVFRSCFIEVENTSAGVDSVIVEYSIDKGANYSSLGAVTSDGKTVLQFPSFVIGAQHLRLRITLVRGSPTSAPRMRRFAVQFLNRPVPIYGFSVTARVGNGIGLRDGTLDTVTGGEQINFLRAVEGATEPLTFTDMNGYEHICYVTKTSMAKEPEKPEPSPPDERLVTITMIEAVPTGRWDYAFWDNFSWV